MRPNSNNNNNPFPLAIAFAFFAAALFSAYRLVLAKCGGAFVYSLDDAYIHLTMARNLAFSGSFGVSPGEFSATSSSPLWTLLLSGYFRLFGESVFAPIYLNIAASAALIAFVYSKLKDRLPTFQTGACLLLTVFAAPLPAMVFSGMEHVLHSLFVVALLSCVVESNRGKVWISIAIFSFLAIAVRYESVFLVAAVAAYFFIKRKPAIAFSALFAAAIPVVAAGAVSMSNGWYFFPNSILLKGNISSGFDFVDSLRKIFYVWIGQLAETPALFAVFLCLISLVFYRALALKKTGSLFSAAIIFAAAALAHLQFAKTGWFYRYETYLVAAGLFLCFLAYSEVRADLVGRLKIVNNKMKIAFAALIFFALVPLVHRGAESFNRISLAAKNIYDIDYLSALFIKENLSDKTVAVGDLGCSSYYSGAKLVDLFGLADMRIARARRAGEYGTDFIDNYLRLRGAEYAIIFDSWSRGANSLPADWVNCGAWEVEMNYVLGDDRISFFAIEKNALSLSEALSEFSGKVPAEVFQSGFSGAAN